MNPETNKFEELKEREETGEVHDNVMDNPFTLIRSDGSPVPKHWSVFTIGEQVVIKDYTFKVAYIGETSILFEPVSPIIKGV